MRIVHAKGFFKEFLVDFTPSGKTVAAINKALLSQGIFGGIDLSGGSCAPQVALYCVTEIHQPGDIDHLVSSLTKVLAA